MTILELRGYSTDHGRLLLVAHTASGIHIHDVHPAAGSTPRLLERDLVDLQSWDRLLRSSTTSCRRLPIKRLRKLTTCDWVRDDRAAGWRVEMQRNVRTCEDWLNIAFAQLPAPQQQEFIDDGLYTIAKRKRTTARAENKHARDLQQYFSSVELVDQVVKLVLEHLKTKRHQDVVWLEPSCGDGRFLTALLREGAQHVIGYEIDERLQRVARNNVRQAVRNVAWTRGSETQAQVYAGDFLASKSSIPVEKNVVAVGNPPFGTKGGNRSDLVHRFFQHSARAWRAHIITFIVPKRCSRPDFIETTLQRLQGDDSGTIWTLVQELPLNDCQFEFNASNKVKRVRQPSVLQLFVRRVAKRFNA